MQLTMTGDTGHSYELQKSTDLTNWDKLFEFRHPSPPMSTSVRKPTLSGSTGSS
jgi:hypothetical protein